MYIHSGTGRYGIMYIHSMQCACMPGYSSAVCVGGNGGHFEGDRGERDPVVSCSSLSIWL